MVHGKFMVAPVFAPLVSSLVFEAMLQRCVRLQIQQCCCEGEATKAIFKS